MKIGIGEILKKNLFNHNADNIIILMLHYCKYPKIEDIFIYISNLIF